MQPSARPAGRLVIAHPDRKAQRALQRLVAATLCPVEVVADVDALIHALRGDPGVVAIVEASLAVARPELHALPARAWIAVPGEGLSAPDAPAPTSSAAQTAAIQALLAAGWRHVVAHPMPILAEELLATVQKVLRGDVFGLEKYIAWGAEVRGYTLEDCRDRDDAVATVARDVVAVGLPERVGSLVSVIADELIANALYVAPMDETGRRSRVADPRERPRALVGRDVVTLRWATDARYLAVEVCDRWGTLDVATVGPRLAAATKTGPEGGMGLPLVYACCNQLAVASSPREKTEVIALLDVRYKTTELGRMASFHAFTPRPTAPAAGEAP